MGFSMKKSVYWIDDVRADRWVVGGRASEQVNRKLTFRLNCSIFFNSHWITSIFGQLLNWMNLFNMQLTF